MNLTGREMVKLADALFKKYRPYTLRLPSGSSITMDNLDSMIKLCKERGIPFDPATYPSRRGEKAKEDEAPKEDSNPDGTGVATATAETDSEPQQDVENVSDTAATAKKVQPNKKTNTSHGSGTKTVRRTRSSTKGK